jgi:fatty-acyl-CoA synthase
VEVGPHDLYGTLATIRLSGAPAVDRAAVTQEVAALLGPYQLRHEVVWAE